MTSSGLQEELFALIEFQKNDKKGRDHCTSNAEAMGSFLVEAV